MRPASPRGAGPCPGRCPLPKDLVPVVDAPLIAHRGASAEAPENTLPAVERAAALGARWIETDVRLTADGALVMLHDATLERTTSGCGDVARTPLETIRSLDAGAWVSPDFAGTPVPTLPEFLAAVLDHELCLQLELKETAGREEELVDGVVAALRAHWPLGRRGLFLASFSERCTRLAAEALPEVPRAHAVEFVPRDPAARLAEARCQILHSQAEVTGPGDCARLRDAGIEWAVATVNDAEVARRFLAAGATSVLTDRCDLLA